MIRGAKSALNPYSKDMPIIERYFKKKGRDIKKKKIAKKISFLLFFAIFLMFFALHVGLNKIDATISAIKKRIADASRTEASARKKKKNNILLLRNADHRESIAKVAIHPSR